MIVFPFRIPPALGETLPVAPGLHWLRMPLPYALDHVNLWLIEDEEGPPRKPSLRSVPPSRGKGWTVVDTGFALDSVKRAWEAVLVGKCLTRQIVTHFHPDHLGLAAWLENRTGAPLWMARREYEAAYATLHQLPGYAVADTLAFFRQHGLDDGRLHVLEQRGNAYARGAPALPANGRCLVDNEIISIGGREWRVLVGRGHSPEHVSLYCPSLGVLISGDMVLPRISTNVSAYPYCLNPLSDFLASLAQVKALPADTLVLPSHGLPFQGLHTRIEQLQAHHAERCEALRRACDPTPKNAAELLPVLFQRDITDPHQLLFAMGEAIAHLHYLALPERTLTIS